MKRFYTVYVALLFCLAILDMLEGVKTGNLLCGLLAIFAAGFSGYLVGKA